MLKYFSTAELWLPLVLRFPAGSAPGWRPALHCGFGGRRGQSERPAPKISTLYKHLLYSDQPPSGSEEKNTHVSLFISFQPIIRDYLCVTWTISHLMTICALRFLLRWGVELSLLTEITEFQLILDVCSQNAWNSSTLQETKRSDWRWEKHRTGSNVWEVTAAAHILQISKKNNQKSSF